MMIVQNVNANWTLFCYCFECGATIHVSKKNWQGKIMHIELGIEKNKVDFYQDRVVSYYLLYIWFYKVILLLIKPLPVVNFTVVKF